MSIVEVALKRLRETAKPQGSPVISRPREAEAVAAADGRSPSKAVTGAPPARLAGASRRTISLDLPTLRSAGLLPPEALEQAIAHQFRRIKRPLIARAVGAADRAHNENVIMVASALPGDGKTFTTVNLAFSMARERDVEVLLIDADVAKPHISSSCGLADAPGIYSALADDAVDVESLVIGTDVPGLSILPAGKFSEESATELLASARFKQVMTRMSAQAANRIILLDSPPLLLTTESQVLAAAAGQVVLVVRAGVTPRQAVRDAISLFGTERHIAFVLNSSKSTGGEGGYYSGYGGYAGYGSYGVYDTSPDPVSLVPSDHRND